MGEPPVLAGAVHVTVADALPAVAVPMVGAPGAVAAAAGVIVLELVEAALVPIALVAVTTKCTGVPVARALTTRLVVVPSGVARRAPTWMFVPLSTCTEYLDIGDPPSLAG